MRHSVAFDQPFGSTQLQVAHLFPTPDEERKIDGPPSTVASLPSALRGRLTAEEQEGLDGGALTCIVESIQLIPGETEETLAKEVSARWDRAQFRVAAQWKTRSQFLGLEFSAR